MANSQNGQTAARPEKKALPAKVIVILMVTLAATAAFLLTACSQQEREENYIGFWKVTEIIDTTGNTVSTADALDEQGLLFTLEIKEDGTATFDMVTLYGDGTWEKTQDGKIRLVIGQKESTAKIENGKLVIGEAGSWQLKCEKSEKPSYMTASTNNTSNTASDQAAPTEQTNVDPSGASNEATTSTPDDSQAEKETTSNASEQGTDGQNANESPNDSDTENKSQEEQGE